MTGTGIDETFNLRYISAMTRNQRAEIIHRELRLAYPAPEVPLDHRDAFTLLVAVALSAQCTDKRVNIVTPTLFALAPDATTMAAQDPAHIESLIKTCGLAKGKAARLVTMSQQLVERHGGEVPDNFADLEALAGVGHKTASVVMNQAFGHPAFPVDTHIYRLARRWKLSRGTSVEQVEADLKKCFAREDWGFLHLAIVLWGREYCPARGCKSPCPICAKLTS